MIKLKTLAEGFYSQNEQQQPQQPQQPRAADGEVAPVKMTVEQKKKLKDMVARYNSYGKDLYREKDLVEIADALQEIAGLAENYAVNECGDFIEEATVKRNMAELKKYTEMFSKLAKETKSKQQQLEMLYEDYGRVIERYFEISD